jgi:dihydrofolate reductase
LLIFATKNRTLLIKATIMRKLILQMQLSLDGFAAGPNGEHDWVFKSGPDAAGFQKIIEIAQSCDTLLLGRKMSQGFIAHWENIAHQPDSREVELARQIVSMRKIIISRSETAANGVNTEVSNDDLTTLVQTLKNEPGEDILVYGGVELVGSLISLNLIDEYNLFICPIALGQGQSIFFEEKALKLESSMVYKNGKVLNKYLPVCPPAP